MSTCFVCQVFTTGCRSEILRQLDTATQLEYHDSMQSHFVVFFALIVMIIVPVLVAALFDGSPSEDVMLCITATAELNGILEPCGCAPDQLGGLPRRHTAVNSATECDYRLLLDNGDFTAGFGMKERLKSGTIFQSFEAMRYFAVNIGEQDLYLGLDALRRLRDIAPTVHLISANVTHSSEDVPFQSHAFWNKRIGVPTVLVTGVLSAEFIPQLKALDKNGFTIEKPESAVERVLSEAGSKADFVVLMVHGSLSEARALGLAFPQIDIVIAGQEEQKPSVEQLGGENRFLLSPATNGEHLASALVVNDPQLADWKACSPTTATLDKSIPSSKEIEQILHDYQKRLFQEGMLDKVPRKTLSGGLKFVGNEACKTCHQEVYKQWNERSHAHAFETLIESGHEYDPDCVSCHVTGFGYESGFYNAKDQPELASVGCEQCHGAGSQHVREPLKAKSDESPYGATNAADCYACHTEMRSPAFDYDAYLPKIKHWDLERDDLTLREK